MYSQSVLSLFRGVDRKCATVKSQWNSCKF